MPDPCAYTDRSEFLSDCITERQRENPDESREQSIAICNSLWDERDCAGKSASKSVVYKDGSLEVRDDEIVAVASTASVDRMGDIVEQNWDLRAFRKNPVLFFSHNSHQLPIGSVPRVWVEDGKLYARAKALPAGMDDFADKVWRFIKGGFVRAVSVGFMPVDEPEPITDKQGRWTGYRYPRSELHELSVVGVPANADARIIARSMGMGDADMNRIFLPSRGVPAGAVRRAHARRYLEIERLRSLPRSNPQ